MSKHGIAFCIVIFIMAVSALFWGLEYFLNPNHEVYVWDQYEDRMSNHPEDGKGPKFDKIRMLLQ